MYELSVKTRFCVLRDFQQPFCVISAFNIQNLILTSFSSFSCLVTSNFSLCYVFFLHILQQTRTCEFILLQNTLKKEDNVSLLMPPQSHPLKRRPYVTHDHTSGL